MQALVDGRANVSMEIWVPNQQEEYDAAVAGGSIRRVGKSLDDNWQSSFIIPRYIADANPGLRSVGDLATHWQLFESPETPGQARLLNCIPGWQCEQINATQVTAYGLQDYVQLVDPGSAAALATAIESAFVAREPLLFYYWGPTTLTHKLNTELGGYYLLEEPRYSDACWEGEFACAYPLAEVLIVMHNEVAWSRRTWSTYSGAGSLMRPTSSLLRRAWASWMETCRLLRSGSS